MRIRRAAFIILICCAGIAQRSVGQTPNPTLQMSGFVQMRAALATDTEAQIQRAGLGIRRFRLKLDARITDALGLVMQTELPGTLSLLDAYVDYHPRPAWRIQLGRLPQPQPAGHIFTGAKVIDAIDRAVIDERWARATIGGDGRDFGLRLTYDTDTWHLKWGLHNGTGSWDRTKGNFPSGLSQTDYTLGGDPDGMATSIAVEYQPRVIKGVAIGGFASTNQNKARSEDGATYTSTGAHVYYGLRPGDQRLRVKAEINTITFSADRALAPNWLGYSLFSAFGVADGAEIYARLEWLDEAYAGTEASPERFDLVGFIISPSARHGRAFAAHRYTFGLGRSTEQSTILAMLQLQLTF